MKKELKFGDKVHDWINEKNYIIFRKSRGNWWYVIGEKYIWKINSCKLKKKWLKNKA